MRRLIGALLGAACLLTGPARAEGPGVKLGDALVLHPGLAIGGGFDSNVFYDSTKEVGLGYVSIRPALDLATLSLQRGGDTPHTLDFRLHLGSTIRVLATTQSGYSRHYSVDVDSGFALTLYPFGSYTFDLFDNFVRSSLPPYSSVSLNENVNSDQNQLGLRLRLRPGGQRLEVAIQYILGVYLFENSQFQHKNDLMNDFQLRVSWKFFPKTALYLQANENVNTYINQGPSTPPSAFPFRVVLGMIGLITPTLSVNGNIGYANSFTQSNAAYPNSSSYNMAIGLLEGTFKPTLTTAVTLGYRHDFAQALIGTYYELNNAYLSLSQLIWRVTAIIRLGWEMRTYHGNLMADFLQHNDTNPRVDNIIALHFELTLPIKDWLFISIGDDLQKNFSNCMFIPGGGGVPIACDYFRNDVWLRLGVAY